MQKTYSHREAGNLYIWMFVIALGIGLLVAFFVAFSETNNAKTRARATMTEVDLLQFNTAVEMYHAMHEKYPTSLADLTKEDEFGAYLAEVPIDRYTGKPYTWKVADGRPYLVSYGADGQPGGTGANADMDSRTLLDR